MPAASVAGIFLRSGDSRRNRDTSCPPRDPVVISRHDKIRCAGRSGARPGMWAEPRDICKASEAEAAAERTDQTLKKPAPPPALLLARKPAAAPGFAPGNEAGSSYRGIDILDPFHRARPQVRGKPLLVRPRVPKTREQLSQIYELGLTSIAMSFHEAALVNMQDVTAEAPTHAAAWRHLAGLLRLAGRDREAASADEKANALGDTPAPWPDARGEDSPEKLQRLDQKLNELLAHTPDEKRIDLLRERLFESPLDVAAMRYLANEEAMAEDLITAGTMLERALALSPNYLAARASYADLLMTRREHLTALHQTDHLLAADPDKIAYRLLRADAAMHMERFDEAVAIYEAVYRQEPGVPRVANSYGRVLKTVGRRKESEAIFRRQLKIAPSDGNTYFGLAELKGNHLTDADIADMRRHLARGIDDQDSRKAMAYALGSALERARDYEGSFAAYALGAEICKASVAGTKEEHDPDNYQRRLALMRSTFTREAMEQRAAPADRNPATTPIFVLGMPRAGSTLVEQILASHSLVEGTRELPVIAQMTKQIALSRALVEQDVYPKRVLEFDRAHLDNLGQECLRAMADYRKTTLPYVIDKRPWNWIDAPFIHLILPQAKLIDIRRGPMAAGFAMFKQYLPVDAAFSYDLEHLGHYYRRYVEHMDHMDEAMPGCILRVSYDRLVDDTETEIRRMLDFCGLPFEESCLRFWETERAVLTPSAEQVRRPIFRDALEQWKNYEPWLGPLKAGLGELAVSA
jgi:tetratricopeptide (TPR) repeat protein